jgi:SAM-dependent methyltransferase
MTVTGTLRKIQDCYWLARFGRQVRRVPPVALMHDGPQSYREFKQNGDEFFRYYVTLCGLQPDEHILDVGSGIGRKTLPLLGYLSDRGSYDGLELVRSAVEWCAEKYTRQYPNFRFHLIDVHNDLYNPHGKCRAAAYTFPFPDGHFDFVVLNSVFTHMVADEVDHYLREIARVLKSGGRCLVSYFLLNQESLALIEQGRSSIDLRHQIGDARALSRQQPEQAIGFQEDYISGLYAHLGLEIRRPVSYGSWCGRRKYLSYQDQVLAFKKV